MTDSAYLPYRAPQLTTMRVIYRWLRAKEAVAEQAQAARNAVIREQLQAIRAQVPA